MDAFLIAHRAAVDDAAELIDQYGEEAALAAALRAEQCRGADNVIRFCHWRQIERLIAALSNEEVQGTIH